MRPIVVAVICGWLLPTAAMAQGDAIAQARVAAENGRRAEGLKILEVHLAATPGDVDARLVYGLILSWESRYDEARTELTAVLTAAPGYLDARVALMNVEWWSGRLDAARAHVNAVLVRDAGNAQARLVQQRLDARTRPWQAGFMITRDAFDDDREPWLETSITAGRDTRVGTAIIRASQADRFGFSDRQVDVEFYPVFRAGTYAFVGAGMGADDLLYPEYRISFDLFQSVGGGFELSGGVRHLAFAVASTLYQASLSKYAGNWMLTGKASVVPDDEAGHAWSYHASVRRYFGAEGKSYLGAGYTHGFTREEPRGAGDFIGVDADTLRGQAEIEFLSRLRLYAAAGASRQERAFREPLWQVTMSGGLTVRF